MHRVRSGERTCCFHASPGTTLTKQEALRTVSFWVFIEAPLQRRIRWTRASLGVSGCSQSPVLSQDIMQNKGHSMLCSIHVITYHENEIAQILVLSRSPDDSLRSACRKRHWWQVAKKATSRYLQEYPKIPWSILTTKQKPSTSLKVHIPPSKVSLFQHLVNCLCECGII